MNITSLSHIPFSFTSPITTRIHFSAFTFPFFPLSKRKRLNISASAPAPVLGIGVGLAHPERDERTAGGVAARARVELERAQPAAARLADVVERASAVQDAVKACEFPTPQTCEKKEDTLETTLSVEWGAVARLAVAMRMLGFALDEPELVDGAVEALKSRGYEGEVNQVAGELCEVPPESENTDVEPIKHEEPRSEAHLEEAAT